MNGYNHPLYKKNDAFYNDISFLMNNYFSLRSGLHHYTSMARNTWENDLQSAEVKLKKYFYALRPLLASLWIDTYQSVPPMQFDKLRTLINDEQWQAAIDKLLADKIAATEKTFIPSIPLLNSFITDRLQYCLGIAGKYPALQTTTEPLNQLLYKTIK